jgi:hypothetical protein
MIEKEHLINILEQTKKAIGEQDVLKLKELSNQTIHSASLNQDVSSVAIAVIIYSLSKIIERKGQSKVKVCDEFCMTSLRLIDKAIKSLTQNDEVSFNKNLEEINMSINKLSPDSKKHIGDVFRKASINKASKIYEHGISMEQTAKLLGITQYDLASYTGQSPISETDLNLTQSVKNRIKLAEDMFK